MAAIVARDTGVQHDCCALLLHSQTDGASVLPSDGQEHPIPWEEGAREWREEEAREGQRIGGE